MYFRGYRGRTKADEPARGAWRTNRRMCGDGIRAGVAGRSSRRADLRGPDGRIANGNVSSRRGVRRCCRCDPSLCGARDGKHCRGLPGGSHGVPAPTAKQRGRRRGRRVCQRRRGLCGVPNGNAWKNPAHHRQQGTAGLLRECVAQRPALRARASRAGFGADLRGLRYSAGSYFGDARAV